MKNVGAFLAKRMAYRFLLKYLVVTRTLVDPANTKCR